jgi:hypothetical protein
MALCVRLLDDGAMTTNPVTSASRRRRCFESGSSPDSEVILSGISGVALVSGGVRA